MEGRSPHLTVLPALGSFTGMAMVEAESGEGIVVVGEGSLVEIPIRPRQRNG